LDKEQVNTVGIDFTFVGESEDKEDDLILENALNSVSSHVVLAYFFDYKKQVPVLPISQLREASYSIGMVNTPQDIDSITRRLRAYIESEGNFYYSFSVALSAAFLNRKPQEIVSLIPLLKDNTFFISYSLRPKDILRLSFWDTLENLPELKKQYGNDFLKDVLVLVYPEAGIFQDTHLTPLGGMSGGLLHLNGAVNIISGRFVREAEILIIPFLILSLGVIYYILKYCGPVSGLLFTLGVFFFDFWSYVLLNLKGLKFDYSRIVILGFLFFVLGSAYKYISSLTRLLEIKNKAALDPLRGIFNLRYFYYRLELETKNIYFRKNIILAFIYLEKFQEAVEGMPLERIKNIWGNIRSIISKKEIFWSVYSGEELVGCIISSSAKANKTAHSLKNNLESLFQEEDIKAKVKLGYLKFKKEYPVRKLLFILSKELKKESNYIVLFDEKRFADSLKSFYQDTKVGEGLFLERLDEDIEEKNRELLSLIENLNKEQAKAKEVFLEIITSLVKALEARDPYSEGHSERVSNYALLTAEKLNWSREEKERLKRAALLHDLGKIGIPDSILHKKGSLNDEEYDFIKKHEIIAVRILEPLKEISDILPWILYHHERWDGKGYPHGLAGNAIPSASQIISLADVFDALTTGRDYKIAISYDEAIKEIVRNSGTQFNPHLVGIFLEAIREIRSQK
jgi:HD-GYP domain-containing protein (c-di-GMP phosphodiesterase class II)